MSLLVRQSRDVDCARRELQQKEQKTHTRRAGRGGKDRRKANKLANVVGVSCSHVDLDSGDCFLGENVRKLPLRTGRGTATGLRKDLDTAVYVSCMRRKQVVKVNSTRVTSCKPV